MMRRGAEAKVQNYQKKMFMMGFQPQNGQESTKNER